MTWFKDDFGWLNIFSTKVYYELWRPLDFSAIFGVVQSPTHSTLLLFLYLQPCTSTSFSLPPLLSPSSSTHLSNCYLPGWSGLSAPDRWRKWKYSLKRKENEAWRGILSGGLIYGYFMVIWPPCGVEYDQWCLLCGMYETHFHTFCVCSCLFWCFIGWNINWMRHGGKLDNLWLTRAASPNIYYQ